MLSTMIYSGSYGFEACRVEELKMLARLSAELLASRPRSTLPTRKTELAAHLGEALSREDSVRRVYASLGEVEQAAVREAAHDAAGRLDLHSFRAKYGAAPDLRLDSHQRVAASLRLLMPTGVGLPEQTRAILAELVPEPEPVSAQVTDELPATVDSGGRDRPAQLVIHRCEEAALGDVRAMLALVEAGRIRVGAKSGRISAAGADVMRAVLNAGDVYPPEIDELHGVPEYDVKVGRLGIRPVAWAYLLQAGRLARARGTKLELTRAGRTALSKPPHEVLHDLFQAWLETELLHELNRVETVRGQRSRSRPLAKAVYARLAVTDGLMELPVGGWVEAQEFERFLAAADLPVEPVRDAWRLYLGDPRYGAFGYDGAERFLTRRFTWAFLLEYVATLGGIDVAVVAPWGAAGDYHGMWGADEYSALSRYDGLKYLRVTPLGAWMLGVADSYRPATPAAATLTVLANRDICFPGPPPSPAERVFLERIAEQTADRVWKLSRKAVLASLEKGLQVESIRGFLGERADRPLPATVGVLLDELEEKGRALSDAGSYRLIECRDESLAVLLANERGLRGLCRHAGENRLLVPLEREGRFRTAVLRAGYVLPGGATA